MRTSNRSSYISITKIILEEVVTLVPVVATAVVMVMVVIVT